jgi:hypothetical protein
MTARRSIVGLTVLCALVFCAFAVADASAAGTTAFTCVESGGKKDFSDADCSTKVAEGSGKFGHVSIANGTTTTLKSVGTTNQVLATTVAGITFEITCTGESNVGEVANEEVEGTMTVTGKNTVITYTGCTVTKPVQGCVVKSPGQSTGTIVTNALKSMSFLTTTPKGVKFEPGSGSTFVEIEVSGCTTAALNGTKAITGTEIAVPRGAFLDTTAASSSLAFGGQKATLTGTTTISAHAAKETTFKPLSITEG